MNTSTVSAHPAFAKLMKIADDILVSYREDLTVHDAAHLASIPHDCPFVWHVRASGTHLFSRDGVRDAVSRGWKAHADCVKTLCGFDADAKDRFWYWDGRGLAKIAPDVARRVIASWERTAQPETTEHMVARMRRGGW